MTVYCDKCQREIPGDESFQHLGQTLCEDCYMDARQPSQGCNPWAVYTATRTREQAGLQGLDGLTPQQQAVYEFVKERGKATAPEVMVEFSLSERELQNLLATLRHCELLRGSKQDGAVYIVPFSEE